MTGAVSAVVRVRFAPSPTGPLHIGGARTALYNFLFARATGGTFVLRIDDTDRERSSEESLRAILDAMRWLGLDWDEGPEKEGDYGPYFQSQRLGAYRARVDELLQHGRAYPCFCTPDEIQAGRERMQQSIQVAMYDRRCRRLSPDERQQRLARGARHTVRFAVPEGGVRIVDLVKGEVEVDLTQIDDWIMLREDGSPLYNLCSVVDDVDMRISHVIRGEDHFTNTVKQRLLFEAFGHEPPRFAHLPLILGPDGKKLSKRTAQTDLLDYRDRGYPPEALVNFFTLLGWGFDAERDLFTLQEAIDRFAIEKLSKSGSIYDEEKLLWMCGMYVRQSEVGVLLDRVTPFLVKAGLIGEAAVTAARSWLENVVACYQERIRIYSELPQKVEFFFRDEVAYDEKAQKNLRKKPEVTDYLAAYRDSLRQVQLPPSWPERPVAADQSLPFPTDAASAGAPWPYVSPPELEARAREVAAALDIGFGQLVHPIRAALTGTSAGAGLFDIVYLLGESRVGARLAAAMAWLAATAS